MAREERHILADSGIAPLALPVPLRALGAELLCRGLVSSDDIIHALADKRREAGKLADILRARGLVRDDDILEIQAQSWGIRRIDLAAIPPDPRLIETLGPISCLRHGFVPLYRTGNVTLLAVSRPDDFVAHRPFVESRLGAISLVLAPERDIIAAIHSSHGHKLARLAEHRVPIAESCRGWVRLPEAPRARAGFCLAILATVLAPVAVGLALLFFSVVSLIMIIGLKLLAMRATFRLPMQEPPIAIDEGNLPTFSIIVALYREADIAARLVRRLARLEYPIDRLDVILAVEAEDTVTRDALAKAELPTWMQVVVVPKGMVRTKPRALNHALDFCRGSIIGIYDAEDAPEPLQLLKVVGQFRSAPPEVACLQGYLDYYNPRTNWISRCFTVEYSSWFRLILPGIARLGLAIPLGGTTLFLRRSIIEEVGRWDAHNVTEDADLGIRLARNGYRTELIATTTEEEANCRPLAWVKQRSRWIKGYLMTWVVHMRSPRRLYRQLGARAFLGFQIMFIGTSAQFLLAPLLVSFIIVPFGIHHPIYAAIPGPVALAMTVTFVVCELVNLAIGVIGLARTRHGLNPLWVATMALYFGLACFAAYKAIYEIATKPFFWDKTRHGLFDHLTERR